jgi:hypothetical protein
MRRRRNRFRSRGNRWYRRDSMRNSRPQALGLKALLQDRPHIKAEPVGKQHARVSFRGDGCGQLVRIHTRGGHELLKPTR